MTRRAIQFSSIPAVPQQGLNDLQFAVLNAIKENLELLIGARGGDDMSRRAITQAQIGVQPPPTQQMQRVTAQGVGFTISGVNVPSIDDYAKLLSDVQTLANDVANIRETLSVLIQQLRG